MAKDERGSILAFTLAVMSLLFVLGTALLMLSANDYLANTAVADRVQAFYLAEAGLAYGKAYVQANRAEVSALMTGSLTIAYEGEELLPGISAPLIRFERDAAGTLHLVSEARVGRAVQVVRAVIE
jgi:hypothetical protein